jgi:hypothetical protein
MTEEENDIQLSCFAWRSNIEKSKGLLDKKAE